MKAKEKRVKEFFRDSENYCLFWEPEEVGSSKSRSGYVQEKEGIMLLTNPEGKTVLDLGSGKGRLAISFGLAGAERVVCLDLSRAMLNEAKKRVKMSGFHGKSYYIVADAEHCPFLDEFFDIVCCGLLLQYLIDTQRAIKEFARVCKAYRLVVAIEPNLGHTTLVSRVFHLIRIDEHMYQLFRTIYYSRLLYGFRASCYKLIGIPHEKLERTSKLPGDEMPYGTNELLRFFRNAQLRIEKILPTLYGKHVLIVARKSCACTELDSYG